MASPQLSSDPRRAMTSPLAFITGCGRSGTTILGQILSKHPDVAYLNDRFDVWVDPLPVTDIWGRRELAGHPGAGDLGITPRIVLTRADANAVGREEKENFFKRLERERCGRRMLIEKLAINNFRLGFLLGLCPDAQLINIVRHGVEVARSIERKANAGQWYGTGDRKWALLTELANQRGLGRLLERCRTPYEKGLLEWRLSVESAEAFLSDAAPLRICRVRYEQLIDDAGSVAGRILEFLGLPESAAVSTFCAREVQRRNPAAHEAPVPESTEAIAGDTLRRLGYNF